MRKRVKGFFLTPDEKGELKFEWIKAIAIAATTGAVSLLMLWGTWVTKQCNVVAENKNLIMSTAEVHQKEIDGNKEEIAKNNRVHHLRETALDEKYDKKISELQSMIMKTNSLVVEVLIENRKQESKTVPAPKWPMSPFNHDVKK